MQVLAILFLMLANLLLLSAVRIPWHRRRMGSSDFMRGMLRHGRRPFARRGYRFGFGFHGERPFVDFSVTSGYRSARPWWEGPNVCTIRTDKNSTDGNSNGELNIAHFMISTRETCENSEIAYRCTKTVKIPNNGTYKRVEVRECCHGYSRKEDDFGCPTATILKSVADTAADLGLNMFLNSINSMNLMREIDNGNFTLFAPTDEAMEDISSSLPPTSAFDISGAVVRVSQSIANELMDDVAALLLGHVSLDIFPSSRFFDEELVETGSPTGSKIRINIYDHSDQVITANCRRITSVDNMVLNGVIHVVEELIPTATESLLDIISRNEDLRFMKTVLGRSGLSQKLRDDGQLTVFAPTDAAFLKMDAILRDSLLAGGSCLEKLVKNHILPNVICSAALQGPVRSSNWLEKYLHFSRDEENKLYIGDTQIITRDIMASNGVLYLIDDVLVPDEALSLIDTALKENATVFVDLIRQVGLEKTLDTSHNVTLFVPTNEAISRFDSDAFANLTSDSQALRDLLLYHVAKSKEEGCPLQGKELDTLNEGKKIRLSRCRLRFLYVDNARPTAQCSPIVKSDIESCNGRIQLVEKVLLPPMGNVVDVLETDSQFSYVVELLKLTGLADALQGNGPFTVFTMSNEVLEDRITELRQMAHDNNDGLKRILKHHIINDVVCCSDIVSRWFFRRKSLSGRLIRLRNRNGMKSVNGAHIRQCDISATNGVVHVINDVIQPRNRFRSWFFDYLPRM